MKMLTRKTLSKFGVLAIAALILGPAPTLAGPPGTNLLLKAVMVNGGAIPLDEGECVNVSEAQPFDTLIAAVLVADPVVAETLGGSGQHTVFAPTDDAFAAVDIDCDAVVAMAETDEGREALTDILLYHVAHGRRDAEDVLESKQIRTLLGKFVGQEAGVLTDTSCMTSNIVMPDVAASNGIIHVIDGVLIPGEEKKPSCT